MTPTVFERAEAAYHRFVPIETVGYEVHRKLDAQLIRMTNELDAGNPVTAGKHAGSILTICALFGERGEQA
jgi:hypothetical protein